MNSTATGSPEAILLEATGQLREIPGHPGYLVTRNGSVYSVRRAVLRELRQQEGAQGYFTVSLDRKTRRVHQLVLEAWVGPRPEGMEARHLDGIAAHNVLGNLAWGTSGENKLDMVRLGTHPNARKTHCSRNHDYSIHGTRKKDGSRRCLPCHARSERERQARLRSA